MGTIILFHILRPEIFVDNLSTVLYLWYFSMGHHLQVFQKDPGLSNEKGMGIEKYIFIHSVSTFA
jgi:hypothetical protein